MAKRAAVAGYFLFSAGVKSAYFVLITLALSIIVEQLAVSQSEITGGYNGLLVDRMTLGLGPLGEIPPTGDVASYYAGIVVVPVINFALKALMQSSFGKVLVGIRENEDRMTGHADRQRVASPAARRVRGLDDERGDGGNRLTDPVSCR